MPEIFARDGARLHYDLHGKGPTHLILLHGLGGSGESWQALLPYLDPAVFRVATLDFRGHGRSRGGEDRFTFPQLTADILAVADHAGMRQSVIVGQSGGGKNAVSVALAAPDRVRGLMLVACDGLGLPLLSRDTLCWLFDYIGREKNIPVEFDPWFTSKIGPHRETVARGYSALPRAVLNASAELWAHTGIASDAARVSQPVRVIAGAREPIYHPEFQRQTTLVALPHAQMEVFDCGHFIAFEEPAALAGSIARFCTELG